MVTSYRQYITVTPRMCQCQRVLRMSRNITAVALKNNDTSETTKLPENAINIQRHRNH